MGGGRRHYDARTGHRNLGFAWLICEPLVFAFPVIAVWSYVRAPFEHGVPMVAFVWSGYLPVLIFRHITGGAMLSLRGNAALFYHSRVTPLDVFIGRQGLEALGNLASSVVSFVVLFVIALIIFGPQKLPELARMLVALRGDDTRRAFGAVRDHSALLVTH